MNERTITCYAKQKEFLMEITKEEKYDPSRELIEIEEKAKNHDPFKLFMSQKKMALKLESPTQRDIKGEVNANIT